MFKDNYFAFIFHTITLMFGTLFMPSTGFSCTDFVLASKDGSHVVGRSMEFGKILPIQIQVFPKGEAVHSKAPNNQKGASWKSKYDYIGMVFKPAKTIVDGFNEKGLSIGALWFPGTQYPTPKPGASLDSILFFADVSTWLLGNFATVDEVKEALPKMNIYAEKIQGFAEVPPIHLSIHDDIGNSLVIEFIDGKVVVHDNPIGVLTNAPEFSWHVTNLRNFISLSAINEGPLHINGTVLDPTGQGNGLTGIPGDWTPPSRFVRTTIFKQAIYTPKDSQAAVVAAIHLLNTVDIPYGAIRTTDGQDFDYTQWIVVKDLKNKKLYYRTYGDQNVQVVSLAGNQNQKVIDLQIVTP